MEGALARSVLVVLNRRRALRVWRGGARGAAFLHGGDARYGLLRTCGDKEPALFEDVARQRASEVCIVRSGFLSRWAQEVAGRR
jgi:hypothetical protein